MVNLTLPPNGDLASPATDDSHLPAWRADEANLRTLTTWWNKLPAERASRLFILALAVVLSIAVAVAWIVFDSEAAIAVGTGGLALGTLGLAVGAREQATFARQGLDAQTQPFLTAAK